MSLDEDFRNYYMREGRAIGIEEGEAIGIEKGIKIGIEQGIDKGEINSSVEFVLFLVKKMNLSLEAIGNSPIPEKHRAEVEKEVRRRMA